ncbi:probable transcription factor At1g11510 [Coffea arabica]|uniref:Probable transcription factor At1g11510 n=1 Tax=Coffea arabica TaxID=13443 RepID=A0A6P6TC92_COFAR|nr:STOREKEEPER protein-like [Coffea arabica]
MTRKGQTTNAEGDALQGEEIPEEEEDKGENDRIPQTQHGKEISEAALQGEEIAEEDQEEKERIPPTQQAAVREVSARPTQYRPTSGTGSDSEAPQKHSFKRPKRDQKDGARKNKTMKNVVVIGARNKENQKKTSVHPTTSSFARVFTEKNEIDILQGMIDYAKLQNVTDLSAHTNAVYEFLKGKLHFEFTKTQVYGKIRRLKNNYLKILEKRKGSGNDPVFLSPRESISFELSKKLWGGVDFVDDVKSGMKKKKDGKKAMVRKLQLKHDDEVNVEEDQGGFKPNHPFLEESSDEKNLELLWMPESLKVFMRGNMTLIDCEKAKELEVKWKELRRKEIELFLMKLNLRMELINHVLDAMKKG